MQYVRRHPRIVILCILAAVCVGLSISVYETYVHTLTISFLDVGQGDAVLIHAPNGQYVLYDAGPPSGAVLRALSERLPFFERTIDMIILSHPDLDHTGGFPDILHRYHVRVALESGVFSGNGAYETVEAEIVRNHIARIIAKKGMTVDLGDGAKLYVLYPDRAVDGMDTNDASIVLLVEYGKTRALLSGDLPQSYEDQLVVEYKNNLHAQILKLGHHGSRTSSASPWLLAVHPELSIISRGINNRYGHPHKEVLERLAAFHIPYLDTAKEGTISFVSDANQFVRE